MNWYERAEQELCDALERGEISQSEYRQALRELGEEMRMCAEEAADQAREDFYGGYGW